MSRLLQPPGGALGLVVATEHEGAGREQLEIRRRERYPFVRAR